MHVIYWNMEAILVVEWKRFSLGRGSGVYDGREGWKRKGKGMFYRYNIIALGSFDY